MSGLNGTHRFGRGVQGRLCIAALSAAACAGAHAQVFQLAYGTPGIEVANDVIDTVDCSLVTAGVQQAVGAARSSLHVVKYTSDGTPIWSSLYNLAQGSAVGYTIQQTSDGGYIVGGESAFGGNSLAKYVLRLGPAGNVIGSALL